MLTPVRIPDRASAAIASRRRSGRGARGSVRRASCAFSVVIVRVTPIWIMLGDAGAGASWVAQNQVGFADDADAPAHDDSPFRPRIERVTSQRRSAG